MSYFDPRFYENDVLSLCVHGINECWNTATETKKKNNEWFIEKKTYYSKKKNIISEEHIKITRVVQEKKGNFAVNKMKCSDGSSEILVGNERQNI